MSELSNKLMYTKKQKPKKQAKVTEREREEWVYELQLSRGNCIN